MKFDRFWVEVSRHAIKDILRQLGREDISITKLLGVWGLSYTPELAIKNFGIGLLGVFMYSFGRGTVGVILSKCMREKGIKSGDALQLRQLISALICGLVILPCLKGWHFTAGLFSAAGIPVLATIAAAAFFATVS